MRNFLTSPLEAWLLATVASSCLLAGCASTPLRVSKKHLIPERNSTTQPVASFRVPSGWRIACISNPDRIAIPPCNADYVLEYGSSQIAMRADSGKFGARGKIDPLEEARSSFLREITKMHDPTYELSDVTKAHSAYGNVQVHHYRGADSDSERKAMVLLIDAGRKVFCEVHAFTEAEMDTALDGLEELLRSVRFLDRA